MKEERKKKRKEKRKNKNKSKDKLADIEVPEEFSSVYDYDDEDVEDKSFDSISDFTTDVKDKVGTGVNSVTSGVSVSF